MINTVSSKLVCLKTFRLSGFLFILISLALFYIACRKNANNGPGVVPVVTPLISSLSGRVVDNSHQPISGASVTVGLSKTATDVNGDFRLNAAPMPSSGSSFVKIEKEGFFTGGRIYRANSGSSDYVEVQLIKKVIVGDFLATSTSVVTIPNNGGSMEFPFNGVIKVGTNALYTGIVSVSAFFINPTANDFQEMIPGALMGVNIDNQQMGLKSYGMIAVEMTDDNNEKLQLAPGKFASLTFPIPVSLLAQAPATIPLWTFNDSTGIWKEEGSATKQGNNYVGKVSHFSIWNCDYPLPVIELTAKIVIQDAVPRFRSKVVIKTANDNNPTSGYGYTDSAGIITGMVPSGVKLKMFIYNKCGESIYTGDIGPYANSVNLGNVITSNSAETLVQFIGSVTTCAGAPLTSGIVSVFLDSGYYHGLVTNGNFSLSIPRCTSNSTTAIVSATDKINMVQSLSKQFTVNSTAISTGTFQTCTSINEYVRYTLNDSAYSFSIPPDSLSLSYETYPSPQYFVGARRLVDRTTTDQVFFVLTSKSTGIAPTSLHDLSVVISTNTFLSPALGSNTIPVQIAEFGPVGGYISGTFSINLFRNRMYYYGKMTADFRVRRIK